MMLCHGIESVVEPFPIFKYLYTSTGADVGSRVGGGGGEGG